MICRDRGFLFVHVPKTAGKSVNSILWNHALTPRQRLVQRGLRRLSGGRVADYYGLFPGGAHATAAQIRETVGALEFQRLFSFAVVRNPWDRIVSMRSFVQKRPRNPHHHVAATGSLGDYVEALAARPFLQQIDFVSDLTGHVIVDRVCRFESLSADVGDIFSRLGIADRLPHKNASAHDDFRALYDDRSAERVAALCDRDIAAFGYSFDKAPSYPGAFLPPTRIEEPREELT